MSQFSSQSFADELVQSTGYEISATNDGILIEIDPESAIDLVIDVQYVIRKAIQGAGPGMQISVRDYHTLDSCLNDKNYTFSISSTGTKATLHIPAIH